MIYVGGPQEHQPLLPNPSSSIFNISGKVKKEGYIQRWIRGVFNEI
jgi:hypothetical protein